MNIANISEIKSLKQLNITDETNESDAEKSMRLLGTFNQCMYGIVNFIGKTPWELHPDDEYLQIVEGHVEITLLEKENKTQVSLSTGDIFSVPKEVWHRQFSEHGVKLLFITSLKGNQHSTANNPQEH
jgi:mannose-6-phosphate isomerase-like protein (cupin superfamily)